MTDTILVDLDGTLAIGDETQTYIDLVSRQLALGLFAKHGHFFTLLDENGISLGCYLIYPGTIELLRYLEKQRKNIVFCSTGIKERNKALVKKLYDLAFGEKAPAVQIISREDLAVMGNANEKNLEKIAVFLHTSINRIMIIDDSPAAISHKTNQVYPLAHRTIEEYFSQTKDWYPLLLSPPMYIAGVLQTVFAPPSIEPIPKILETLRTLYPLPNPCDAYKPWIIEHYTHFRNIGYGVLKKHSEGLAIPTHEAHFASDYCHTPSLLNLLPVVPEKPHPSHPIQSNAVDVTTQIRVVLDLDGPLVLTDERLLELLFEKFPQLIQFKNAQLLISIQYEPGLSAYCLMYPGTIELLRYIRSQSMQPFIFCSAGIKRRNEALVAKLLELAFGKGHSIPYHIFSRGDLIYDGAYYKKDLNMIAKRLGLPLHEMVIVDDIPNLVCQPEQQIYPITHQKLEDYFNQVVDWHEHLLSPPMYITGVLAHLFKPFDKKPSQPISETLADLIRTFQLPNPCRKKQAWMAAQYARLVDYGCEILAKHSRGLIVPTFKTHFGENYSYAHVPSPPERSAPLTFFTSESTQPEQKKLVVLDLDETLVLAAGHVEFYGDSGLHKLTEKFPQANLPLLRERGLLIPVSVPRIATIWHMIYPGTIELLRYLHSQNVTMVICSNGAAARNTPLVEKLFELAFDNDEAPPIPIISAGHPFFNGTRIKPLAKIATMFDTPLYRTLIADNDPEVIPHSAKPHHIQPISCDPDKGFYEHFDPRFRVVGLSPPCYIAGILRRLFSQDAQSLTPLDLPHTLSCLMPDKPDVHYYGATMQHGLEVLQAFSEGLTLPTHGKYCEKHYTYTSSSLRPPPYKLEPEPEHSQSTVAQGPP